LNRGGDHLRVVGADVGADEAGLVAAGWEATGAVPAHRDSPRSEAGPPAEKLTTGKDHNATTTNATRTTSGRKSMTTWA